MKSFARPHDLPYISDIMIEDKALLQQLVSMTRPQSKSYEDSWGYIIQATRYGGFKWFDPQTGSLIFFGRKSEKDPTLVIPNFFASPRILSEIIREVQQELNVSRTIIKNVSNKVVERFITYGFRPYDQYESWSAHARFDDQTYPQVVVDLEKIVQARGPRYQKLRTIVHKTSQFKIIKYNATNKKAVLNIFTVKDKKFISCTKKHKKTYYITHAMYPVADIEKYIVTDSKGKVLGFTATSDITSETTALVAALFKPGDRDVSLWGTYQTLAIKYWQGFQFANLGGSEFEVTHRFKTEKFRPSEQLWRTHLVFEL